MQKGATTLLHRATSAGKLDTEVDAEVLKMAEETPEMILSMLNCKILEGEAWLVKCKEILAQVHGVHKLEKKLKAELNFLRKLQKSKTGLKFEQVHCSNLLHLTSIIRTAINAAKVTAVLQPFHLQGLESESAGKVVVDVVGDNGRTWTKVVARNQHSMRQISMGQGQFGERSILDHAQDLIACARVNLVCYSVPTVRICFYNGVTDEVAEELRNIGVDVKTVLECDAPETFDSSTVTVVDATPDTLVSSQRHLIEDAKITCLNLDVSTMLAYVSSLTNGGAHFKFDAPVLSQQAANERCNPVKPLLEALFCGRTLLCCETALKDFENILEHIAGKSEKERGRQLLESVKRVPDRHSSLNGKLKLGGKIRQRSLKIFGTGEAMQAVTVTANVGFVRAAESQVPLT